MADINKLQTLIQLRRGYQAQWDSVKDTYIPKAGEPCVTLDGDNKGQIKVGDGVSTWGELKYVGVSEGAIHFIGTVEKKSDLPETANTGDIYQVVEDNNLYIWDGDSWEIFHAVDLSNYYTKEETTNLIVVEIGKLKEEISGDYALKSDLEVIKIYGDSSSDTSMEVDGQTYDTASEAIAAVSDGGTIKLNGGLGAGEVINAEKKFTVDLNSAVIIDNDESPVNISINGDLTLTGNGSVECNKHGQAAIGNNGKLTIEDGSYTRTVDVEGDTYYTILNHGEMVINSGVFEAPRVISSMIANGYYDYTSTDPAVGYVEGVNMAEPKLTVNGGTFINGFHVIKNDDGAVLTINDGKFYGDLLLTGKDTVINGGYFEATKKPNLYVRKINDTLNTGKTYINGGTFVVKNYNNNIESFNGKEIDVIIKGGRFNVQVPDGFIAEGCEQNYVDGYYVVSAKA